MYGYFLMPTPEGMINDGILNLNETFVADLREALAEYKMKSKQVVFTLTSTKIASREVTIPFVKENRIMDVVNANASDYFPVDLSQYQLAYSMLGVTGNPKSGQQYKLLVLAAPQALLDGLPGREQVREGDDAEIVHERRPQHRRAGKRRRHAGDHLDLHRFDPLRQLEQRPGHAIDPRVPAA